MDEEAAFSLESSSWVQPPWSGSTDTEDAAPPVSTWSRVRNWAGLIAGVAVILAITFVPLPSLGLLLWHAGRVLNVDVLPQQIYWEDLQPGMCVREDPNDMDYLVVDCHAEHEEEVISRGTLAGSKEWPGDAALENTAGERCKSAFATYVGLGWDDSRLDFDFVTPDEDGWTDGKVTLICLVMDPDHDQVTRSLRGAHE